MRAVRSKCECGAGIARSLSKCGCSEGMTSLVYGMLVRIFEAPDQFCLSIVYVW